MIFRRAGAEDVPAIVAMLADDHLGAIREDTAPEALPRYLAAFHAVDQDPNQLLAVLERDGQVIGCLQIAFLPGLSRQGAWRGQIESVRIAASHRGQGLGATFIRWAIERCREHGCTMVQLTSDASRTGAHRFYERLGFHATHVGMKLVFDE
ncbi:MAG: GNAT family N-acetyltransferase [Geminicoccaceae bacterium]|nr:MAG: GNAT family N-acetyltransferase [Geminicoccaceae bacterium]